MNHIQTYSTLITCLNGNSELFRISKTHLKYIIQTEKSYERD